NLTVECSGSFNRLLGGKSAQIDLLDSEETISTLGILYLKDIPKSTLSHWDKNTVSLFEQQFPRKGMHRCFTDETTLCLVLVGCATTIAVELRRKCHICATFSNLSLMHYYYSIATIPYTHGARSILTLSKRDVSLDMKYDKTRTHSIF